MNAVIRVGRSRQFHGVHGAHEVVLVELNQRVEEPNLFHPLNGRL